MFRVTVLTVISGVWLSGFRNPEIRLDEHNGYVKIKDDQSGYPAHIL